MLFKTERSRSLLSVLAAGAWLVLAAPAFAGPPIDLAELLESPPGRALLKDVAIPDTAPDEARQALERIKLGERLRPGQAEILFPHLPADVATSIETRTFVPVKASTTGYAANRQNFVAPVVVAPVAVPVPAPAPKAPAVPTPVSDAKSRALTVELLRAASIEDAALRAAATRKALIARAHDFEEIAAAGPPRGFGAEAKGATPDVIAHLQQVDPATRVMFIEGADDALINKVPAQLDETIAKMKLSDTPALKAITAGDATGKVLPKAKQELFNKILNGYFDRMPLEDKRPLAIALLELPADAPLERQLSAVLQNSGPALQKLFQLLGRESGSPIVRAAMAELLSNVKPFEGSVARKLLEQELGRPIDEVFSYFNEKPVASATVGQVHKARLRSTGEEVVVKLLRPGIGARGRREMEALRAVIGDTAFERNLVDTIEEALMREVDLRTEALNLELGEGYVSKSRRLGVAGLVPGIPVTENMMVQKLARGTTMSKLEAPMEMVTPEKLKSMSKLKKLAVINDLRKRGAALERLLSRWFERALFDDGFFHADLHPGNLFYEESVMPLSKSFITLIDFGSADRLASGQQRNLVNFVLAIFSKSPDMVMEKLGRLMPIPANAPAGLRTQVASVLASDVPLFDKIKGILGAASENEVKVPRELFLFARGDLFLENQLREINRALDTIGAPKMVGRFEPMRSYVKASARHVATDGPGAMVRELRDGEAGMDDVFTRETIETLFKANLERLLYNR